jgi:hypothetical protein
MRFYILKNQTTLKWGLGIGDWGLGIGPNPQSPIPNPQSKEVLMLQQIKN